MKIHYIYSFFLIVLGSIMATEQAYAAQAQLLLYPTRIIMEDKQRTATVGLKNTGNATGVYRVELIDMHMPETGSIVQLPKEESEPYSAKSFLRTAPRSVTLGPNEDQNIRIMLRKRRGMENAEYRAHLKVTMIEDNAEATAEEEIDPKHFSIRVKPRLALVIPVIIRHGELTYAMAVSDAKLRYEQAETGEKTPYLDLVLERNGNRSSMGDLEITYITPAGKKHVVKYLAGVPVYHPTPRRQVSLTLDIPEGVKIDKGSFHITYHAQKNEGGHLLAEGTFPVTP